MTDQPNPYYNPDPAVQDAAQEPDTRPEPGSPPRPATATVGPDGFDATAKDLGIDANALYWANRDVLGSNPANAEPGTPLVVPADDAAHLTADRPDYTGRQ